MGYMHVEERPKSWEPRILAAGDGFCGHILGQLEVCSTEAIKFSLQYDIRGQGKLVSMLDPDSERLIPERRLAEIRRCPAMLLIRQ